MTNNDDTDGEKCTVSIDIPLDDVHATMVEDLEDGGIPVEQTLQQQPQVIQAIEQALYQLHTQARYQQQPQQ